MVPCPFAPFVLTITSGVLPDYHITVYTDRPGSPRVVQNLIFSTYGPNNKDNVLQGSYFKTSDGRYIQNAGGSNILSMTLTSDGSQPPFQWTWARNLNVPVYVSRSFLG